MAKESTTELEELKVTMIETEKLVPSPTQPRRNFNPERQSELTESMRQHGFTLSALTVRQVNSHVEIVLGERRWRSAKEAGIAKCPCFIRKLSDKAVLELQLIENLQREDLTPMEEAESYQRLLAMKDEKDAPLYTKETLAQRIGVAVKTVERSLQLCGLDGEERAEVEAGRLPPKTARLLTRIPAGPLRQQAAKMILHPQHEEGPLSYAKAEVKMREHFVRDLRAANFELADEKLYPMEAAIEDGKPQRRIAGGACTDCPMKATVHHGFMCLNPYCFETKQSRVWDRWKEARTDLAKNRKATTEEESRKLYPNGNSLAPTFNLVDLAERPDGGDLKPGLDAPGPWRELIKGADLFVIVTKDRLGKMHELVDRDKAIAAARTINKHEIFKTTEREKVKPDEMRKTEEKKKTADRELQKEVLLRCIEEVRRKYKASHLQELFARLIDREFFHTSPQQDFLKRHGLPIGGTALNQLRKRPLPILVAMLVEFVVTEAGFIYDVHDDDLVWLKMFGVNFSQVKAATEQAAKAEKKTPAKKAKKGKK